MQGYQRPRTEPILDDRLLLFLGPALVVNSRSTRRIQKIKVRFRRDRPQPCMRCGQPIDYDAPPNADDSFSLGHILSWANYPELREDPGNVRAEHLRCNKSAGADDGISNTSIGQSSRAW